MITIQLTRTIEEKLVTSFASDLSKCCQNMKRPCTMGPLLGIGMCPFYNKASCREITPQHWIDFFHSCQKGMKYADQE